MTRPNTDPALFGPSPHAWPASRWPRSVAGRCLLGLRAAGWKTAVKALDVAGLTRGASMGSDKAQRWLDAARWPSRPIRVGLVQPGRWAEWLVDAPGACGVEWFTVPEGEHPEFACREHALDAVVTRTSGRLEVVTLERPGHDAGWYDWSVTRPYSYVQVFPMRIDCARMTLETPETDEDACLARAAIEAAAVLARSPARLTLADRLAGRSPATGVRPEVERFGPYRQCRDGVERVMQRLTELLLSRAASPRPLMMERACARAVGAWLTTWGGEISDTHRRQRLEAIARINADEPDTMLRLAAARFACFDDAAGLDALVRADRMLRHAELMPGIDQFTFIQGELQVGQPTPLTIGRVAAGLCLLSATMPVERLPFCREDLGEEMEFSRLLVGRDQDRALLLSVFREIERGRRADRYGLPPKLVA